MAWQKQTSKQTPCYGLEEISTFYIPPKCVRDIEVQRALKAAALKEFSAVVCLGHLSKSEMRVLP